MMLVGDEERKNAECRVRMNVVTAFGDGMWALLPTC